MTAGDLGLYRPGERLYLADPNGGRIFLANLEGTFVQNIATGLFNPSGLDLFVPQLTCN